MSWPSLIHNFCQLKRKIGGHIIICFICHLYQVWIFKSKIKKLSNPPSAVNYLWPINTGALTLCYEYAGHHWPRLQYVATSTLNHSCFPGWLLRACRPCQHPAKMIHVQDYFYLYNCIYIFFTWSSSIVKRTTILPMLTSCPGYNSVLPSASYYPNFIFFFLCFLSYFLCMASSMTVEVIGFCSGNVLLKHGAWWGHRNASQKYEK